MAEHQHISFTASDIEKYHRGLLSPAQMHAMEKAALDDPFLADAIEGYATKVDGSEENLRAMQLQLEKRTATATIVPIKSRIGLKWLKVAVLLIGVAGAAVLASRIDFHTNNGEIAQSPSNANAPTAVADSPVINIQTADTLAAPATNDSPPASVRFMTDSSIENPVSAGIPSTLARDTLAPPSEPAKEVTATSPAPAPKVEELVTDNTKPVIQDNDAALSAKSRNASQVKRSIEKNVFEKDSRNVENRNAAASSLQLNMFRGRVTDQLNNALPFANVTNPADNVGTYTDAQGYFTLVAPDTALTVQVRSLGFENRQAELLNQRATNQVVLNEDRMSLDELVLSNKKVNSNRSRTSTMVLEEPEPQDGWTNYDTYLANNLKQPEGFEPPPAGRGEVQLQVEINAAGEPVSIKVTKSLCESCDQEAIRLVRNGPKWKRKGKSRKTTVTVAF